MRYIIYKITHKPTGLFYIGRKTAENYAEFDNYWGSSHYPGFISKGNKKFKNKKGYEFIEDKIDEYSKEIIAEALNGKHLGELEDKYIELNFNDEKNVNMYYNGNFSTSGYKFSDEMKKFFSESRTGKKNNFYGKKHTEAAKKKMRKPKSTTENMKGIAKTEEHKKKLAEATRKQQKRMLKEGKSMIDRLNVQFKCPYDDFISTASSVSRYIKRNFPDLKQWKDLTKEEKDSLKRK